MQSTDDGHEDLMVWTETGKFYLDGKDSKFDLCFAPSGYEGWVNTYKKDSECHKR